MIPIASSKDSAQQMRINATPAARPFFFSYPSTIVNILPYTNFHLLKYENSSCAKLIKLMHFYELNIKINSGSAFIFHIFALILEHLI